MKCIENIKKELKSKADAKKASDLMRFFKTGKGQYGEGDKFLGVNVPSQRAIAKKYYSECSLAEISKLLKTKIHEYRLTALFILVYKFEKTKDAEIKKDIADFYIAHTDYVNNWDLVDLSAYKILGSYLMDKDRTLLYEMAEADHLWTQRISIIATFFFIRNNDYVDTLFLAKKLLGHKHDLIHKAVGWMLREIGKRDYDIEYDFLKEHYGNMPRTMLRYAIEKFAEDVRQDFLKGRI